MVPDDTGQQALDTDGIAVTRYRSEYCQTPLALIDLQASANAFKLYAVLWSTADFIDRATRPVSRTELADLMGCSVKTIGRTIKELEKVGAVEVRHRTLRGQKVASAYHLPHPSTWTAVSNGRDSSVPSTGQILPIRRDSGDPTSTPKDDQRSQPERTTEADSPVQVNPGGILQMICELYHQPYPPPKGQWAADALRAATDLAEQGGVTPASLRLVRDYLHVQWDRKPVTPLALAKHWPTARAAVADQLRGQASDIEAEMRKARVIQDLRFRLTEAEQRGDREEAAWLQRNLDEYRYDTMEAIDG